MRSHYVSAFSSVRLDGENATKTSGYTQSFYENASFSKRVSVSEAFSSTKSNNYCLVNYHLAMLLSFLRHALYSGVKSYLAQLLSL